MSRLYHDRFSGRDFRVPSRTELIARSNVQVLKEKGIDPLDVHCECCGIQLRDIGKIKFTDHIIGPECSKHPELFPCRHAKSQLIYTDDPPARPTFVLVPWFEIC